MTFTLTIELGSPYMQSAWEVSKAVWQVADRIRNYNESPINPKSAGFISDVAGRTVGHWEIIPTSNHPLKTA